VRPGRRPRTAVWAPLFGAATLLASYGGLPSSAYADCCPTYPPPEQASAQSETLTLLDGHQVRISSYFARPVMAWFVSNKCVSCAASIRAVAKELGKFEKAGVSILVLGIYGQFGSGAEARADLMAFGKAAARGAFRSRLWAWGLASRRLSATYDPRSVPDYYLLLARGGKHVYENVAPVSTMADLLRHVGELSS
jgi:hypothetical protein